MPYVYIVSNLNQIKKKLVDTFNYYVKGFEKQNWQKRIKKDT